MHYASPIRVAGVGWLLCTAAESLRAFVESVFANFRDKTLFFTIAGKQAICGCEKTCSESTLKTLQKLSESGLSKSSPKQALRKLFQSSTKALRKRALQKLSESRLTFVESPSKAS